MMRVHANPVVLPALALALAALGCDNGLKATATKTVTVPATPKEGVTLGSADNCRDEKDFICKGDRAEHRVTLTGFELEVTEVTRLQYQQCLDQGICDQVPIDTFRDAEKDLPVRIRSPLGAQQYCATVGGRLPTEAEFEYAARLGKDMKLHTYPWGDSPPDCKDVPYGTCPNAVLGPVGTHPVDANGVGVLDLAGSVPEWVDGYYNERSGCVDHLGYADACVGSKTPDACAEARCVFDEASKGCARGCFPDVAENGDVGGRGLVSTPVCPVAPNAASPIPDPIDGTQSPYALVRGGGLRERACTLAGYTRRHTKPGAFAAGFRCVKISPTLPVHPDSYRFVLEGCPAPDYEVQLAVTNAADGKPFPYELHAWPYQPGAIVVRRPIDGVVDRLHCGDTFVIRRLAGVAFNLKVEDADRCAVWIGRQDIAERGDVPNQGVETVELAGNDETMCRKNKDPGTCKDGPCQMSCTPAGFQKAGLADNGHRDCNTSFLDGCESDTQADVLNCGTCGAKCAAVNKANMACVTGRCSIASCIGAWADCDGQLVNGCEVDRGIDPKNCGACRQVCSTNHIASAICTAGVCNGACDPGWFDCNKNKQSDGCESPAPCP